MLNNPALNPMATANPARIRGVATRRVSEIELHPTKAPEKRAW
jgi:hypothetical protein